MLFIFDPWGSAILLVGGDKSGNWTRWYRTTIPKASGCTRSICANEQLIRRTKDEYKKVVRRTG